MSGLSPSPPLGSPVQQPVRMSLSKQSPFIPPPPPPTPTEHTGRMADVSSGFGECRLLLLPCDGQAGRGDHAGLLLMRANYRNSLPILRSSKTNPKNNPPRSAQYPNQCSPQPQPASPSLPPPTPPPLPPPPKTKNAPAPTP